MTECGLPGVRVHGTVGRGQRASDLSPRDTPLLKPESHRAGTGLELELLKG